MTSSRLLYMAAALLALAGVLMAVSASPLLGVVLIIASVVFRYGAELAHPGEELA